MSSWRINVLADAFSKFFKAGSSFVLLYWFLARLTTFLTEASMLSMARFDSSREAVKGLCLLYWGQRR